MSEPSEPKRRSRRRRIRLSAVIVLAIAAGLIAWLVVGRDDDGSSSGTTTPLTNPTGTVGAAAKPVAPVVETEDGLRTLAHALSMPIYWAGPKPNVGYELTVTSAGYAYVRYLTNEAKAGDTRASFLIIATYPFPNAYDALEKVAKGRAKEIPGGGLALVETDYPRSVHVAFPGVPYQIEVFDPSPQRSLQVALSGDVKPVS